MKCIAVVMMAFIAAANAGAIAPLAYGALPYGYSAFPYAASWNSWTPAISQYSSLPAAGLITAAAPAPFAFRAATPWAYPYGYAAATPYAAAAIIPGEARYRAINRGALHDAPLPGHSLDQTSINLSPAPGTL